MSSPSIRKDTPASPRLSLQQIAERSQRQLIVTAVLGTLCTLLIVLMFILFHEVVPLGVDSVTGSSVIETEQHIRHMFAMGHHKDALDHLNTLIQEKPLHRWEQHLDLMDELLRKSNLKTTTTTRKTKTDSSSSSLQDDVPVDVDGKEAKVSVTLLPVLATEEDLFQEVELTLEVIERLKGAPDSTQALADLNQHTASILASCMDANNDHDHDHTKKKKEEL